MKDFLIVFTGQGFSLFGSQLVQFTLVWWLTLASSGSATVLALAVMVALFPQIVIAPFIGPFIDRWNRKEVIILADGAIALSTIVIALLFAFDLVQIWHIYLLMLLRSVGGAFHWPSMQSSASLMVPKKHLARMNGLTQSLQGLMNVIAPPLGAILIGILPIQNILAIDVVTAVIAIVPLLFIHIPQPMLVNELTKLKQSILSDLSDAFKFLWSWKGGLFILIGAMITNLLIVPALSLLPILVVNYFKGSAFEFASLTSALGIGTVTGMISFISMGISIASVGFLPQNAILISILAFFFTGFMMSMGNGSIFAILQAIVPADMQGRVFTLAMSGSAAMTPIGLAVAGPLSDSLGVQIWFLIGGIVMIAVGVFAFFSSSVMNIEENEFS
jgi:DHA3 family macrolide efflux protein-like MFS transporter